MEWKLNFGISSYEDAAQFNILGQKPRICIWLHQHFANSIQQTIEISLGISWERSWRSTPARCWAAFACAWALRSSTCTVQKAQNGTEGIAKPEHKERSAESGWFRSPNFSLMEGEEKCKNRTNWAHLWQSEQQNLVSTNCKAWEPWPWLLQKQCRYPRSVPAHAERARRSTITGMWSNAGIISQIQLSS